MAQAEWHKQLTKEIALQALAWEVNIFIERMRTAMPEAPRGPQLLSEAALAQLPTNAMLVEVLYRSLLGGDPDGAPGKALMEIKREVMAFHQDAAKRLAGEIKALEKLGGAARGK